MGAEAPKVSIPILRPAAPVYRSHPSVEPCSTLTRAHTAEGRTLSRYSSLCLSKSSHEGMLTTLDGMPF